MPRKDFIVAIGWTNPGHTQKLWYGHTDAGDSAVRLADEETMREEPDYRGTPYTYGYEEKKEETLTTFESRWK